MINRDAGIQHIYTFVDFASCEDNTTVELCWSCADKMGENVELLETASTLQDRPRECVHCGARNGFEVIQNRAKLADTYNARRYF